MLNNTTGYDFYFAGQDREVLFTFPITPPELTIKMGTTSEVVNLINDGNINILKSLDLTEIEFEATFPMRGYPYSREVYPFKEYFDILKGFMVNKKWFRFVVSRSNVTVPWTSDSTSSTYNGTNLLGISDNLAIMLGLRKPASQQGNNQWRSSSKVTGTTYEDIRNGDSVVVNGYKGFWDTNLPVSLESMEIKENADDGDDVVIEFKLKQYKSYGVKFLKTTSSSATTSTAADIRWDTKPKDAEEKKYTIVAGDTLTIIAKKFYDDGSKWELIYNKNKDLIEKTAKDMGKKSSQHGNYIWAGVTLIIPPLT